MDKKELISRIEKFAPPETAEDWDCPGWITDTDVNEVNRVMLCLTVGENVISQAKNHNCDMIISHHPLFFVPLKWRDINIYCAHTNLDFAKGGTTDVLVKSIFGNIKTEAEGFLRYVNFETDVSDFVQKLRKISPNLRYVNNLNVKNIRRIAFCAGSGSEFIKDAQKNGADAFVTGDLKFHTAFESDTVLFDIGHFESEIGVLKVFYNLIKDDVEVIYAEESSPFII